jgi:heptosyltransferase-2/heptosyltransferase-3
VTAELHVPVLLFAGPDERRRLDQAREHVPAATVLAPALGARRFAAVVARCAVFISGDTGPMHLAAAVGVPTVAIFSSARSRHYRPRGPRHRSLFDEDGVQPEGVLAAVAAILAGATAPATGPTGDAREASPAPGPPAA